MFQRLDDPSEEVVTFTFDGRQLNARRGDNLAAALLAAGMVSTRTTSVSGEPRGPFCMMGACYDCIVEIDGETVQACVTPVTDGLKVHRVTGPETGAADDHV